MTKPEVNKLLALMKANYSYAFKCMSQQDKYLLLNTWTFALQDLNADVVMIAVMQLISVSKWLPTVAEIREKCKSLYYTAAYAPDEPMIEEGASSEQAGRKKRAMEYIANATKHLRGEPTTELKLDYILENPAFISLGAGKSSFEMIGDAKYELSDSMEGNYEQGDSDRQPCR